MKKMTLLFVLLSVLGGCQPSDLRPLRMRFEGIPAAEAEHGKLLWEQMLKRIGAPVLKERSLDWRDTWHSFFRRLFQHPWKTNPAEFTLTWKGTDVAGYGERPELLSGKAVKQLNMLGRLLNFRNILGGCATVAFAGEAFTGGETYQLVFFTANKGEPQPDTEQYLLWLNRNTGLPDHLQFTMRDVQVAIYGTVSFSDWITVKEEGGEFLFPGTWHFAEYPGSPEADREMSLKILKEAQSSRP